ncbi:MAG: hypothetical protein Q8R97_06795 [Brevundimonas sp.]|jgi:hypothetical protein|uniref:hypothetical protein n=1 Tax=Brevundimonas sp. TaxID=1871086 RepID=UPI0027668826|nr:hypothetical protein [Brevundimonas sp.]MDP3400812.1 hypothetical protein [Brevundimonas sp.]MDZ4114044.1 hypothetical protein [Brevundimonas sp.]
MAHAAVLPVSLVALALLAVGSPALAQVRAPTAQPAPQPGVRAPDSDPSSQAHSTILLRLDAVEQSARRQIVVLEFDEATAGDEIWPASSDNSSNNGNRVTAICSAALADRFGRVVSYQRAYAGDRYFFGRVVCETN